VWSVPVHIRDEERGSLLLAGTYVATPVRRKEIEKPGGGVRTLGIPTVLDRFIQQLLLQVMTPIWEPLFSDLMVAGVFQQARSQRTQLDRNGAGDAIVGVGLVDRQAQARVRRRV